MSDPTLETKMNTLLSSRFLLYALGGVGTLTFVFGALLISVDAFEEFHAFTRSHESWNLDEWAMGVLAALISVAMVGSVLVYRISRQVVKAEADRYAAQLLLEQSRSMAALGTLVAGTAHSINNHLVPVISLVDLVRSQMPVGSPAAQDLDVALKAARSAAEIVTRMKTFSKTNHIVNGSCQIAPVTRAALDLMHKVAPSTANMSSRVDALFHQVDISASAWEIVILNLVNNAIDALEGRVGGIDISLQLAELPKSLDQRVKARSEKWVCLKVRDSGKGMDEGQLKHIFEPFFTTKPVGKGTGLGLSESFGIVENAGGVIDVHSRPGQGTEFVVWLPAKDGGNQSVQG